MEIICSTILQIDEHNHQPYRQILKKKKKIIHKYYTRGR